MRWVLDFVYNVLTIFYNKTIMGSFARPSAAVENAAACRSIDFAESKILLLNSKSGSKGRAPKNGAFTMSLGGFTDPQIVQDANAPDRFGAAIMRGLSWSQSMTRPYLERLSAAVILALLTSPLLLGQTSPTGMHEQSAPSMQYSQAELNHIAEEGQRALAARQYTTAEREYQQLLKLGVRSPAVYSNLGVVYMRTGRFDQAIRMLLEAKSLAPAVLGVRLNLGLAYFRKDEFKPAAAYFGEVITSDPGNTQARYLKGICHFMLDDFSDAVAAFEPLQAREQSDLEYLFMLGTSYGMLKRTDDSMRVFKQMVEAGGDTPHLHLLLGKAYLALGQNENAASELKRAAETSNLPFAHYYLGMLDQQLGRPELAAGEFEKEVEVDPTNASAYKELADIRLHQPDPQAAIAVLERGIARNRNSPELFAALGRAYLEVSNETRAIIALKKAIALSPSVSSSHYELGRAYLKAGRRTDASAEMERARTLATETPQGKMRALSRAEETVSVTDGSH